MARSENPSEDSGHQVPYGPDFTPAILGKEVGKDHVLGALLADVDRCRTRAKLQAHIAETYLKTVPVVHNNRRDMASHVVAGLRNYKLIMIGEGETVELTKVGRRLLDASGAERDVIFATHILCECNGLRLVEVLHRAELRGHEAPSLEELARELDRNPTSKNVSAMRAWLARAGVVSATGAYRVDMSVVRKLLGDRTLRVLGLPADEFEFVVAAHYVALTHSGPLSAQEVADLVEARCPDIRIRRKSLGALLERLKVLGVISAPARSEGGKGGSSLTFMLELDSRLTEEALRALADQTAIGGALHALLPLEEVFTRVAHGSTDERGHIGEMLGLHVCLMLDLKVIARRLRAPNAELDLVAERSAGLSYQRWSIQVKNTTSELSVEQVDREVGAAAAAGLTHVLFIVPRARLTPAAQGEITQVNQFTPMHVYTLTAADLSRQMTAASLIRALAGQMEAIAGTKRAELKRRQVSALHREG